jgi:hypothetical protein
MVGVKPTVVLRAAAAAGVAGAAKMAAIFKAAGGVKMGAVGAAMAAATAAATGATAAPKKKIEQQWRRLLETARIFGVVHLRSEMVMSISKIFSTWWGLLQLWKGKRFLSGSSFHVWRTSFPFERIPTVHLLVLEVSLFWGLRKDRSFLNADSQVFFRMRCTGTNLNVSKKSLEMLLLFRQWLWRKYRTEQWFPCFCIAIESGFQPSIEL